MEVSTSELVRQIQMIRVEIEFYAAYTSARIRFMPFGWDFYCGGGRTGFYVAFGPLSLYFKDYTADEEKKKP